MPRQHWFLKAVALLGGLSVCAFPVLSIPLPSPSTAAALVADAAQPRQVQENSSITRQDFYVTSDPGVQIFVRAVTTGNPSADRPPILLIHGGGPGGITSFDLGVPGYSLAADLAETGHPVYVMNVRGWEQSTRPAALDQVADANLPAVTSKEAVRDIAAVVNEIRQRHSGESVALVGWATGGHWAGMYTSQHNDQVSHLILLNSLYGVNAPWELRTAFEDEANPGVFDARGGAYRLATAEGLIAKWSETIPTEDKHEWRDPLVAQSYQVAALASDPTSTTRNPASMRIPAAYRLESYNLSKGQRYWDAVNITVPTLVVRGELDFWSRPADMEALATELVNTPVVETVTIPNGTHYLFLDRPERGRDRFLQEVIAFVR